MSDAPESSSPSNETPAFSVPAANANYTDADLQHLSDLERAQLARLIQRPLRDDPQLDRIAERGELHEAHFLEQLRAEGLLVTEIPWEEWDADRGEHMRTMADATLEAMRSGVEVVFQATFFDGRR